MTIIVEAVQTLHRLSLGDTLIAAAAGAAICLTGPLIHELGHLVPARLLCRSGRITLFPFRALGGVRAWIVICAIEMPDAQLRRVSARKAAMVLAGGAIADLVFICWCALAGGWLPEPIGVGVALGGAARAAGWLLNLYPIPALNNDGARFVQFVLGPRRRPKQASIAVGSMIYFPLLAAALAAGVLFLLWQKERKIKLLVLAEAERLALENKQHEAKLVEIYAVVTRIDCGAERLVGEHDELARSLQQQAVELVRAEPALAVYLNRNYCFHKALLDVVRK